MYLPQVLAKIVPSLKLCGMMKIRGLFTSAFQISGFAHIFPCDSSKRVFYNEVYDGDIHVLSRAFVPAVLLGEAESKLSEQSQKNQDQQSVRNGFSFYHCCILQDFL